MNEIANNIMSGNIMELDIPSKNSDNKMSLLDVKVWIERDSGNMHADTAQAVTWRNSIHT